MMKRNGGKFRKGVGVDDFAEKPFTLHYNADLSLRAMIHDLLAQARDRDREEPGATYVDTVLYYLISAQLKLSLVNKNIDIELQRSSGDNIPSTRTGNFLIRQFDIHVTIYPTLALLERCKADLAASLKPIIITGNEQVETVEILAEAKGIADRMEIWSAEQFLVTHLHLLSGFGEIERATTVEQLVSMYNNLIDRYETDPSLRISIGK